MLVYLWLGWLLFMVFILGSVIGSFLNVCIARLPEGQSLAYPGSRCGACGTPIHLRDNLPLLSYWLLRGRCRACGTAFSMRYFWVELATGLGFAAVLVLEVGCNIHRFTSFGPSGFWYLEAGQFPPGFWPFFLTHLLMVCLLTVAFCCAAERQRVPFSVLAVALFAALLVGMVFPWPWPHTVDEAVAGPGENRPLDPEASGPFWSSKRILPAFPRAIVERTGSWSQARACPPSGLQPWPVWGPPPAWLPPGTWQLGLATCLAGALFGGMLAALVHCGFGRGGQGNICLLAMTGAFLGWQPVVTSTLGATLLAVLLAPLFALFRVSVRGGLTCCLGLGVLAAWLGWPWLGPLLYPFLFNAALLPWGFLLLVILPLLGLWLRMFQRFARMHGPGSNEKPRRLAAEV